MLSDISKAILWMATHKGHSTNDTGALKQHSFFEKSNKGWGKHENWSLCIIYIWNWLRPLWPDKKFKNKNAFRSNQDVGRILDMMKMGLITVIIFSYKTIKSTQKTLYKCLQQWHKPTAPILLWHTPHKCISKNERLEILINAQIHKCIWKWHKMHLKILKY